MYIAIYPKTVYLDLQWVMIKSTIQAAPEDGKQVNWEMQLEAEIVQVRRCTWRSW